MYSRRISFRATPQTAKQLEETARAEGTRQGELLRRLIKDAHKSSAAKPSTR